MPRALALKAQGRAPGRGSQRNRHGAKVRHGRQEILGVRLRGVA